MRWRLLVRMDVEYAATGWQLALSAEEQCSYDKECGAGAAEKDDGVAVGGLYGRGSGAGAVETLGAALAEGLHGHAHGQEASEPEPAEAAFLETCILKESCRWELHCPNSSRRKRKIQRTPMTCQYQTVVSTKTWRVESERENFRAANATIRLTRPRKRCTAWVMVMR